MHAHYTCPPPSPSHTHTHYTCPPPTHTHTHTTHTTLVQVRNCIDKTIPQPIRHSLLPPRTLAGWRKFVFVHLPVLHWLWLYKPKDIIGDLIAGITIGVTHIPQGRPGRACQSSLGSHTFLRVGQAGLVRVVWVHTHSSG